MKKAIIIIIIFFGTSFSRDIISWVPYNYIDACTTIANEDFGTYSIKDGLTDVSLQYWAFDANANVNFIDHSPGPSQRAVDFFIEWGNQHSIKTLLCCTNLTGWWNWDNVTAVLGDNTLRQKLISNLIQVMNDNNLDGIDIDFEGSWGAGGMPGREDFATFIRELSSEMKPNGKKLSVSTFHSACINAPNMSWWEDWAGYVDNIQSMGYNDVFPGGTSLISNCTDDASQNGKVYNTYKYEMDYAIENSGLDSSILCIGMPGWLDAWGWSLSPYLSVQQCLDSILALKHPTGIAIWDFRLSAGGMWKSSDTWEKIKTLKEYGDSIVTITNGTNTNVHINLNSKIKTSNSISISNSLKNSYKIAAIYNLKGSLLKEVTLKNISIINFNELGITEGIKIVKFK